MPLSSPAGGPVGGVVGGVAGRSADGVVTAVALLIGTGLLAGALGPLRRRGHRSLDAAADRATQPPSPPPSPSQAASAASSASSSTAQDEAAVLQAELRALVRRVNAAGGRLPVGAVPAFRAVEDVLRPLLTYAQHSPASPQELHQLSAMVREHLPSAVDHYLALPASYTSTASRTTGRTPAHELLAQLQLLREGADQLAQAVYDSDAQALAVGRRFLDTKFHRSDLDL